jgi:hypothetical protein
MIHTAFLTDYSNRIYTLPAPHSALKLFLSLCPGNEITTAQYEEDVVPQDFYSNWHNYKFKAAERKFVAVEYDATFVSYAIKIDQHLKLWQDVISKLNFIYDKESDPFKFNRSDDNEFIENLRGCQQRCEQIIIASFHDNITFEQARFNLNRETFNNILL